MFQSATTFIRHTSSQKNKRTYINIIQVDHRMFLKASRWQNEIKIYRFFFQETIHVSTNAQYRCTLHMILWLKDRKTKMHREKYLPWSHPVWQLNLSVKGAEVFSQLYISFSIYLDLRKVEEWKRRDFLSLFFTCMLSVVGRFSWKVSNCGGKYSYRWWYLAAKMASAESVHHTHLFPFSCPHCSQ